MLLAGDEMGRTQGGNNNAYCQDSAVSWLDWGLAAAEQDLLQFTETLAGLRRDHAVFRRRRFFRGQVRGDEKGDIVWLTPAGGVMTDADWDAGYAKSLAVFLNGDAISEPDPRGGKITDDSFLLLFNAHSNPLTFTLPDGGYAAGWEVVIDTARAGDARGRSARRRTRSRSATAPSSCYGPRRDPAPAASRPDSTGLTADLAALYAYPDGRWLRANMVSSADGAATLTGASAGLSSDTDRRLFALLRTLSDVILVGAATVRTERYKPARQPRSPGVTCGRAARRPRRSRWSRRRLDLDPDSPLITAAPADARTIVITTAQAPPDIRAALEPHADVIVAGEESVDFKAAVAALAERGHRRLLAEGGPHLLAELLAAGLLDELCLTIGPLLAGPGPGRIVAGPPARRRPAARPGSRPGGGRLPVLPLHQENQIIRPNEAGAAPPPARSGTGQQAALEADGHGGGPVVDAELGVDVQQVGLDRGLADEQAGAPPPGWSSRARSAPSISSSRWLSGSLAGCADLAEQPGGDRRRQHRLASGRGPDAAQQLVAAGSP